MSREFAFRLVHTNPSVEEFQSLRLTTGWDMQANPVVKKSLSNTLFAVCAYHKDECIGMGRVIGDGATYFYIQDLVVLPEYQKRGVGKSMMEAIMLWCERNVPQNALIGLFAAKNSPEFYRKFGFEARPPWAPGMQIIKR